MSTLGMRPKWRRWPKGEKMREMSRHGCASVLIAVLIVARDLPYRSAMAADRIRIAAQSTGTLAWELDILKAHGLDRQAGIDIETTELASTEAGKVALESGSVDLMLSDWLWVTRERALGDDVVFYPYSSALGAVMVPANSPIGGIADLEGKKLAIAGGPLDKSWLLLQALARRSSVDLKTHADIVYGAPPLLQQKALQGEADATLTFWNFCAELEANGMRRAVAMDDVVKGLGAVGPVAMVGYVFNGKLGTAQPFAAGPLLRRHAPGQGHPGAIAGRVATARAAYRGKRGERTRRLSAALS